MFTCEFHRKLAIGTRKGNIHVRMRRVHFSPAFDLRGRGQKGGEATFCAFVRPKLPVPVFCLRRLGLSLSLAQIKQHQMRPRDIQKLVEDYIGTSSGYLNQFSYSIHDRFYHQYCDLDVDVASYRQRGHTTRTAFIEILKTAPPRAQASIIRGVFEMIPPPGIASDEDSAKRIRVHRELIDLAGTLASDGEVPTPQLILTSEVVYEALYDAETLIATRGARSAVDRAHTALHGYLKKLCADRSLPLPSDASLTMVFKIIREQFTEFQSSIAHDVEAKRVFGALSNALDSLNTIRNRGTLAHPNEILLEAPEAMLYINLARTTLGYLESRQIRP